MRAKARRSPQVLPTSCLHLPVEEGNCPLRAVDGRVARGPPHPCFGETTKHTASQPTAPGRGTRGVGASQQCPTSRAVGGATNAVMLARCHGLACGSATRGPARKGEPAARSYALRGGRISTLPTSASTWGHCLRQGPQPKTSAAPWPPRGALHTAQRGQQESLSLGQAHNRTRGRPSAMPGQNPQTRKKKLDKHCNARK